MNTSLMLKAIPVLALAVITISRGVTSRQKSATKNTPTVQLPVAVAGSVQKVMKDARYVYVLVERDGQKTWVGARDLPPEIGTQVSYRIEGAADAYESQELAMAFERVLFAASDEV